MRLPMKRVLAVLLLLGLTACRETFRKAETVARPGSEPKMFRTVDVPMLLDTPEQRAEYVAKNYWNHFDFSDTSYVDLPEVTEQAFADYVNLLGQMARRTRFAVRPDHFVESRGRFGDVRLFCRAVREIPVRSQFADA